MAVLNATKKRAFDLESPVFTANRENGSNLAEGIKTPESPEVVKPTAIPEVLNISDPKASVSPESDTEATAKKVQFNTRWIIFGAIALISILIFKEI